MTSIDAKLQGCGNSFFIVDEIKQGRVEDRKRFVLENADEENVDGVMFLTSSSNPDAPVEMIFYDRDGTQETMCGNGVRCLARYAYDHEYLTGKSKILTGDGIKKVEIFPKSVKVFMGKAREFKQIDQESYFVYTGVPHLIVFEYKLDINYSREKGRYLRHDKNLGRKVGHCEGVNINFTRITSPNSLDIMTYEVGVEDVTMACGTGSTAAAYVASKIGQCSFPIKVKNIGGSLKIDSQDQELTMEGNAEYL